MTVSPDHTGSACTDPRLAGATHFASRTLGALFSVVLASSLACYQGVEAAADEDTTDSNGGSAGESGESGETGETGETGTDSGGEPAEKPSFGPTGLRLLTPSQYQNSVGDVLGPVVAPTVGQWRSSIAAAQGGLSVSTIESYEDAAITITATLFADPEARMLFAGCAPAALVDDPCVNRVLASAGRRAWRRPLTADELARYAQLVVDVTEILGGDPWAGLQHAVAGMLQSPNFIYRVEIGTPVAEDDPDYVRLNGFEVASRLSYLLWNTTPDDALLDAAELGELDDGAGLDAQVDRLLESPRAIDGIFQLFVDMYNLDTLLSLQKDPMFVTGFTETIGPAMRQEIFHVVEDTLLTQRDYRRLFDTPSSFVNAELATHYGIEGTFDETFVPAPLPEGRGGILTLAGFLAINSGEASTSPTKRGLTMREVLMCQVAPPPPPNVVPELPEPSEDEPKTKRELLEQHVSDPTCAGCHAFTDPIGLSLEHFDALGSYRATDNGLEIDPSGELDGKPFADAIELGGLFAEDAAVADCLVRNLYRYATGHVEQTEEAPTITELRQSLLDSGYDLTAVVEALVRNEGFRYATLSPEEDSE